MNKHIKGTILIILAILIIPIMSVSSQDEYILLDIKQSNPQAFTQGFELNEQGNLVLATGIYGESDIGYLDLETGEFNVVDSLESIYFGEGITYTPNALWQLTWKEHKAFKRDPESMVVIDQVEYEGEGWGLAYDEDLDVLWMSDGSNIIQQRDPESFELMDTLEVRLDNQNIEDINELEYANGYLYANIWYTNTIIVIDPNTGDIVYQYDLTDLLNENLTENELDSIDSLNGIAHIEGNRFYITGKLYPKVFEIELLR